MSVGPTGHRTACSRYVVGGYTDGPGQGVGVLHLEGGRPVRAAVVAEAQNPSWVLVGPSADVVYAALEREDGAVAAWRVAPDGDGPWPALGEERASGGSSPCHLALTADGRHLLVANYGDGSVAVLPVAEDGSLGERTDLVRHEGPTGPNAERQDGPHAHQCVVTPTGHVLVCDLGLDAVVGYELSPDGRLTEVARSRLSPGSGPRHLALSPDGATAWVACELTSTVVTCDVDGARLTPRSSVSTRAPHLRLDNLAASILVTDDGSRVLVSNRGDDTIAVFDVETGLLRRDTILDCSGHWPRAITWGPDGELLVAAERSDIVVRIDPEDGRPSVVRWPSPTCLAPLA
ncbi:lactonase family protein [Lapillicoccus jejuensis]|uniref:6-phosphogluconolactonase n=1 Tax=Lapillicoccus jejuensis TaxID=402171 RepID=A0A542E681_9MICO|nr:lactonase family protein [Lapillicoccus jejuensis]TQJ10828.1 6-phosphogluconolactonase [Lapillicoccus jejuensis]